MRRKALLCALIAATGCNLQLQDEQGKTCVIASDCRAPYTCVQLRKTLRTCELLVEPAPMPIDVPPEDAGQPFYCSDVGPVFRRYCGPTCHGPDTYDSMQDFRLDYYQAPDGGLPGAVTMAAKVKIRAYDLRDMPPAGSDPMPSALERQLLRDWVVTGARYCDDGGSPDAGT